MRKHGVKFSQQDFLDSAKERWGDTYDYSLVKYEHALKKITIICKEHGEFTKTPAKHVNTGQGCPKCSKRNKLEKVKLGTEEFIKRSIAVHNGFYDYSKVVYGKNELTPVVITCPEHGDFKQDPKNHMRGNGCPKCGIIKSGVTRGNIILSKKFNNIIQPKEYRLIPLGNGNFTKVDIEDFEKYGHLNWHMTDSGYAEHHTLGLLHTLIMNTSQGLEVDHENRDRSDNRRRNLRIGTSSDNKCNRAKQANNKTSSFKGVSWNKEKGKYVAQISYKNKHYKLGYFNDEFQAGKAYDIKAVELHKEFAYLNFPEFKDEYLKQLGLLK